MQDRDVPPVGAPGAPSPGAAPVPQQTAPYAPHYDRAYAPSAGAYGQTASATRRGTSGWRIVAAIALVIVLGSFACCAWSVMISVPGGARLPGRAVAVIHIDGVIAGTDSGSLTEGTITPERVITRLQRAEKDSSVEAILLRIDSAGGTAAASEEIAVEVAQASKPVVASIGDLGASGAYMIASQCDEIVANADSSIGSIGVVLQLTDVQELLDKLGIEFTILKQGEYKDIGSPYRALRPDEKALLDAQMKVIHEEFIGRVAKGRRMTEPGVRKLATGRLFLGKDAKEKGLVDRIGTYSDALDRAAELGGIEGEPQVVSYDEPTLRDVLGGLLSLASSLERIGVASDLSEVRPALPK